MKKKRFEVRGRGFVPALSFEMVENAPVILKDGDAILELNVLGYQFPHLDNKPWDSDWLVVEMRLELRVGKYVRSDPCLTTFELQWLIEWLRKVRDNFAVFEQWDSNTLSTRIFFTENNLDFAVSSPQYILGQSDGAVQFVVCLGSEFLPPFKDQLQPDTDLEVLLPFRVTLTQLTEMIASLENQLKRFPVRVGLPTR